MKKLTLKSLAIMGLTVSALFSCGQNISSNTSTHQDTSTSSSKKEEEFTITFDYNYTGSSSTTVKVPKEGLVSKPTDPLRTGYFFNGWWLDSAATTSYNFSAKVTSSFTLYANWIDSSSALTATFYWNYEGETTSIYKVEYFSTNGRVTKPSDPEREGYYFSGWYEENSCTTEFSFMKKRSENTSAYAYWVKSYTFEAEYTQLTGLDPNTDETCNSSGDKLGQGYSGNVTGKSLICANGNSGANASNGYYVSNLYYNGAFLEYKIVSDKAVSNVYLQLNLSAEFYNISISSDDFLVEVNGIDLTYNDISFTDVITDMNSEKKRSFSKYYINKTTLVAGENSIKLIVNNDDTPQVGAGSMDSKAPMIDCLYLTTEASLTWSPYTSNLC